MATFEMKRGDTVPPLKISMRISGSDPERFFRHDHDDITTVDDGQSLGTPVVKFIMTNIATGAIVGKKANRDGSSDVGTNTSGKYTGLGEIAIVTIPGEFEDEAETIPAKKTILTYRWAPPDVAYNPSAVPAQTEPAVYEGDTARAGQYRGEFEVIYNDNVSGKKRRKRTFPSTSGDSLIINILPDDNDKRNDE